MKINIKNSALLGFLLVAGISHAQIRIANSTNNTFVTGSSAFIDASSNLEYNNSTNVGKGLLYPRTDLSTFTAFGGAPIGLPTSFPTFYDGFVVYNTKEGGVAGVGTTQGTLTPGFWYYENKSSNVRAGTWKPFVLTSDGEVVITNQLTNPLNTITSNVNGILSSAPVINTNLLSLSGESLTSTVNGVASNALNLKPLINDATTNSLKSGGIGQNTLISTVNGVVSSTTAVKTVNNLISGNKLTTTVNGISSTALTLPDGVNIYNANGSLLGDRIITMNNKRIYFRQSNGNEIYFDAGASNNDTDLHLYSTRSTILRSAVGSSRLLDLEVMSNGSSRLFSTGSTELFIGTNTSSGPLVFGVNNHRAVLQTNGNFGIGTTNPSQKLHVIGNILATGTITPDYVFEKYFEGVSQLNPSYRMMSLEDVEEFTRKNKHLPGVPSASEIENQGGIILNRASEINLEKIEELYLHVIELNKQIKILQEKNEQLEKMINKN